MLLRPGWLPDGLGVARDASAGTGWVVQMLGAREIGLGAGALVAGRRGDRPRVARGGPAQRRRRRRGARPGGRRRHRPAADPGWRSSPRLRQRRRCRPPGSQRAGDALPLPLVSHPADNRHYVRTRTCSRRRRAAARPPAAGDRHTACRWAAPDAAGHRSHAPRTTGHVLLPVGRGWCRNSLKSTLREDLSLMSQSRSRRRRQGLALLTASATALTGSALLLGPGSSSASSHREAPQTLRDPLTDNTDVYAFVSPDKAKTTTLIANFQPFQDPSGGPNFYPFEDGDSARYEINVDNDGDAKPDITYRWTFTTDDKRGTDTFLYNNGPVKSLDDETLLFKQTYTLERIAGDESTELVTDAPVAPSYVGDASIPDYALLRDQAISKLAGRRPGVRRPGRRPVLPRHPRLRPALRRRPVRDRRGLPGRQERQHPGPAGAHRGSDRRRRPGHRRLEHRFPQEHDDHQRRRHPRGQRRLRAGLPAGSPPRQRGRHPGRAEGRLQLPQAGERRLGAARRRPGERPGGAQAHREHLRHQGPRGAARRPVRGVPHRHRGPEQARRARSSRPRCCA